MKRIYIVLAVWIAFAIGAFAGFRYASHRYGRSVTDTVAMYEFGRATDVFGTLRDLRAGNTNAVMEALESELDTSVIGLRGILDDYPTVGHAKNYTNLLRRIGEYRAAFPYHNDPDVSVIVRGLKKEEQ